MLKVLSLKGTEKILAALTKQEKLKFTQLSDLVGHTTTTTRALKALQKDNLVRREVLDESYRPVAYSLTEKGKRLRELMLQIERL